MSTSSWRLPRTVIITLSGFAALACRAELESIALQIPTAPGDRSLVLALSEADGTTPLVVKALDLVEGRAPVTDLLSRTVRSEEGLALDVTALVYEQPLEVLGIPEGELEPLPTDTPAVSLPEADRMYSGHLSRPESIAFRALQQRPALLDGRYLPAPAAPTCALFDAQAIPLGSDAPVTFLLGLERGALVTTERNEVFFVTLAEGARPLSGPATTLFDGFAKDTGELWLAGRGGQILQGRLHPEGCARLANVPCESLVTTLATVTPSREDLLWISGPSTETPRELFTLSGYGELSRVSIDEPTIESVRLSSDVFRQLGGVAWVAPQEAVAVFYPSPLAYRWTRGVLREERLEPLLGNEVDSASTVTHVDGFGTIIGSREGLLFRDAENDGPRWIEAAVSRLNGGTIVAISPYEQAFVFLDASARVTQYEPRVTPDPFCPWYPSATGMPEASDDVTIVGRDIVAAGAPAPGQPQNYVRWLVRR